MILMIWTIQMMIVMRMKTRKTNIHFRIQHLQL